MEIQYIINNCIADIIKTYDYMIYDYMLYDYMIICYMIIWLYVIWSLHALNTAREIENSIMKNKQAINKYFKYFLEFYN